MYLADHAEPKDADVVDLYRVHGMIVAGHGRLRENHPSAYSSDVMLFDLM